GDVPLQEDMGVGVDHAGHAGGGGEVDGLRGGCGVGGGDVGDAISGDGDGDVALEGVGVSVVERAAAEGGRRVRLGSLGEGGEGSGEKQEGGEFHGRGQDSGGGELVVREGGERE